jgi:transcriptional regulator with GAF, ATPase, and Fis domain
VDVRVIAATNRDLEVEVGKGRFRSDLYYRLGVFPIESPPLRERREDIPAIAAYLACRFANTIGRNIKKIDELSMNNLASYHWPGNVRELRNVIERAVILCQGTTLMFEESLGDMSRTRNTPTSFKQDLHAIERTQIQQVLITSNWKIKGKGGAADRLGLKPSTLRSRIHRLGISRP